MLPCGISIQRLCSPETPSRWVPPLLTTSLDQVDVWQATTRMQPDEIAYLRSLLCSDEIGRVDRFRFERDRNQSTIARGLLRLILAAYLGADPRELRFRYSANGKPELLPSGVDWDLRFNVAHSGELILMAFARNRRIGVDVEKLRNDIEVGDLAGKYFSGKEQSRLMAAPHDKRHTSFFECWARKEAYIKATGDGLSLPLQSFDVYSDNNEYSAHLLRTEDRGGGNWWIDNLPVSAGYAAALAIEETAAQPELQERGAR